MKKVILIGFITFITFHLFHRTPPRAQLRAPAQSPLKTKVQTKQNDVSSKKILSLYQGVIKAKKRNKKLQKMAINLLRSQQGEKKELGLLIASTQNPHQVIFDSILKEVLSYYDQNLIEHSFLELNRYLVNQKRRRKVIDNLSYNLNHGSLMVAQAMIKKLHLLQELKPEDLDELISKTHSPYMRKSLRLLKLKR